MNGHLNASKVGIKQTQMHAFSNNFRKRKSQLHNELRFGLFGGSETGRSGAEPGFAQEAEPNLLALNELCTSFKGFHKIFCEILKKQGFLRELYRVLQALFAREFAFLEDKFEPKRRSWGHEDYSNLILKNLFVFKENFALVFPSLLSDFFASFSFFLRKHKLAPASNKTLPQRSQSPPAYADLRPVHSSRGPAPSRPGLRSDRGIGPRSPGGVPANPDSGSLAKSPREPDSKLGDAQSKHPLSLNFLALAEEPGESLGLAALPRRLMETVKENDSEGKDRDSRKTPGRHSRDAPARRSATRTLSRDSRKGERRHAESKPKRHRLSKQKIRKKLKNFFASKFELRPEREKGETRPEKGEEKGGAARREDKDSKALAATEIDISAINFDLARLDKDFKDVSESRASILIPIYSENVESENPPKQQSGARAKKKKKKAGKAKADLLRLKFTRGFHSLTKSLSQVAQDLKKPFHPKDRHKARNRKGSNAKAQTTRTVKSRKRQRQRQRQKQKKRPREGKISVTKIAKAESRLDAKQPKEPGVGKSKLSRLYNPFDRFQAMSNSLNSRFHLKNNAAWHKSHKTKALFSIDFTKTKKS